MLNSRYIAGAVCLIAGWCKNKATEVYYQKLLRYETAYVFSDEFEISDR